jgi:TonB-dependent receptor
MTSRFYEIFRAGALAGVAATAIVAAAPAAAQSRASYNIAAQDLGGGLRQLAAAGDIDILYSPSLVANRRTHGLNGTYSPLDALRELLRGTGLTFQQPSPDVFVLRPVAGGPGPSDQGPAEGQPTGENSRAAATPGAPPGASPPRASAAIGTGSLVGSVIDAATGAPLAGAALSVRGTSMTAISDEHGAYRFPVVPAGPRTIALDYLGAEPQASQVTITPGGQARLDFTIGENDNTIVVTGFVSSIQRALNKERSALNNQTVVSEDLLGGFPAETVSEALRRVPGVAFGRDPDTGEGSRITVRGFSSEAIQVQLNGINLQGTNFTRTIDLSGFLAENISTVTISRSLLPSQEATGSGGFVQIETRSGLDYGDFYLSGDLEGETNPADGFGREFQANGTFGGKITPNFGIVGTIAYRDTHRRNFDIFNNSAGTTPEVLPAGYTSLFFVPFDQLFPFDPEFADRLDSNVTYGQRTRDETNLAASVNVAWDIDDHTRLRLDLQHNDRSAQTFISRAGVQYLTSGVDMPIGELGGEVRRRFVLSSLRPGLILQAQDLNLTTDTASFRGDTHFGRWQFRYQAGYSAARSRSSNNAVTMIGNSLTNLTDLIDPSTIQTAPDSNGNPRVIGGVFVPSPNGIPLPALTDLGRRILFDPATYRVFGATRSITNSPTHAWTASGSARYTPGSFLDYVEAGFKYDRSTRSALDDTFATDVSSLRTLNNFTPISGRNTFLSDLGSGLLQTVALNDIGLGGFSIPSISASGNEAIFRALEGLLVDNPATPFNEARFTLTDAADLDPISDTGGLLPSSSVEAKLAGYLETHFVLGDFDLVGGARIERSNRTGTTISIPSVTLNTPTFQREPRETFVAAGLIDFTDLNETDTTITPSFLLNYRPTRSIVARLGWFRSTVNPSIQLLRREAQYFIDLRPAFNSVELREGNPDLKPSTTDNWDFDVAYYFPDSPGLIRLSLFYKRVNNNFTNVLNASSDSDELRQRALDYFAPLAASRPDLIAYNDDTQFILTRPTNGEGGKIYGGEIEVIRQLNFLPGFLGGFGVIGNLTYTRGDFPTLVSGRDANGDAVNVSLDRPLADEAEWVYNLALTYARGPLEGRLSYTHQSATVALYDVHDLNSIIPHYSTLDLRVSYNFGGPGGGLYTIYFEGNDLLRGANEPDIRAATASAFNRSDASFFFPNTYQFSGGRTFTLGVQAHF